MTSASESYGYAYGLFLGLEKDTKVEKRWKNGAVLAKEELESNGYDSC